MRVVKKNLKSVNNVENTEENVKKVMDEAFEKYHINL